MSRIIVTGAHGFTGRYLVDRLVAAGHEVHGFARAAEGSDLPALAATHRVDLGDAAGLADAIARIAPDAVVHLAAIAFVAHGDAEAMYRTNLIGTRNLLQALVEARADPRMVILASSANVYGNQQPGALEESAPMLPANDYAVSKAAMEMMARLYADRLPIAVVRPFNYTGVGQAGQFVIPKIVDHVRRREPVIELGDLSVERDFSDVRDVVDRYARLLDCDAARGGVFNVCSGRSISLADVLDMVRTLSGHPIEARTNPAFVRAGEVRALYGDDARLTGAIGPLTRVPFEDTLRWMLEA